MKLLKIIYILVIGLFSFPNFGFTQEPKTKPELKSKSFERTIDAMISESVPLIGVKELSEELQNYLILDAREEKEYTVSHIKHAQYIGYKDIDFSVIEGMEKDTPIVVYCSIGVRSEDIGEKLKEKGFTNVQNLYGSIFEWANQGYPLVDNDGNPTKKIHGYSWLWGRWMTNEDYEKVY